MSTDPDGRGDQLGGQPRRREQVVTAHHGDRGDRGAVGAERLDPADDERGAAPEALARVDVLAAGVRVPGGELGEDEARPGGPPLRPAPRRRR